MQFYHVQLRTALLDFSTALGKDLINNLPLVWLSKLDHWDPTLDQPVTSQVEMLSGWTPFKFRKVGQCRWFNSLSLDTNIIGHFLYNGLYANI